MSVQSISRNKVTQTTILDYDALLDQVTTTLSGITSTSVAADVESAAKSIRAFHFQLSDMSRTGMSTRYGDVKTSFDALLSAMSTVNSSYSTYLETPTDVNLLDTLRTDVLTVKSATATALGDVSDLTARPAIQDTVFYHYSRAGEADLNNQLGQLGDAMDDLNYVLRFVNNIDVVLSINPKNSSGVSYVNEEGELATGYETSSDLTNVAGSGQNAIAYMKSAYNQLIQLQTGFDSSSSVYQSIQEVVNIMGSGNYNVSSMSTSDWSKFQDIWQDTTLRRKINDLLTSLSSQSDVEKQNLRKAMFLYQEFVKSSGSIMDRIFEAGRSIASRIAR